MIYKKIFLKDYYSVDSDCTLEIMIPEGQGYDMSQELLRAMVIVPGGGYSHVSKREGDPVAFEFLRKNYACFILCYSTNRKYPVPHRELACAFDYVRRNSDEFRIDKTKVSAIGFSAGGHLLGSYSYLFQRKEILEGLDIDISNLKPDVLILSYPVITMKAKTHGGTRDVIAGEDKELLDLLSIEDHITPSYPKTFIWHTMEDESVPVDNTFMMKKTLDDNNVENKMILFPHLGHGLSTCNPCFNRVEEMYMYDYEINAQWVNLALEFLDKAYE